MLYQAKALEEKYLPIVSKESPPSSCPRTEAALDNATWFILDVNHIAIEEGKKPLAIASDPSFLNALKEIGVEGIYLKGLGGKNPFISSAPLGSYSCFVKAVKRWGFSLAAEGPKPYAENGIDFLKALQNEGEYPSLFHLVEIEEKDWPYLPRVFPGKLSANISWLEIQKLEEKGYVPERFRTYSSKSFWNATREICGVDGKMRRWIYLKSGAKDPTFNWLSPGFSAYRIAASVILEQIFGKNQSWISLSGELPSFTKEMLSLWIRKLQGFSCEYLDAFSSAKRASSDLLFDTFTRRALLDALITENASVLRCIYGILQNEGIESRRWIHALEPFDTFACSWDRFLFDSSFLEKATKQALAEKLLKRDLYALEKKDAAYIEPTTWVDHCRKALQIENIEQKAQEIQKAHLLLAFAYAMQPGAFFFSASDLLGALPSDALSLRLLEKNRDALYPSLFVQMQSPLSFAAKLKKILEIRSTYNIAKGKILSIPKPKNRSCFLLVQELPRSQNALVLALNFGRRKVVESIDHPSLVNSFPIDLMESEAISKKNEASSFSFSLFPLSGKVFLIERKYFDE